MHHQGFRTNVGVCWRVSSLILGYVGELCPTFSDGLSFFGSIFWILLEPNLAPSWDTLMQELVLDELAQYVSGLDELVQFVSGAMCF